jgi:DNA repair protein RadC
LYNSKFSIKQWAEEDRPREKLLLKGKASLSNAELMAILIRGGTTKLSAVDLSKQILNHFNNNLHLVGKSSIAQLTKFEGIGNVKAITIVAALELGRRRQLIETKTRPKITSSQEAFSCVEGSMTDLHHEEFRVLLLNRNNQLLKIELISVGGVAGTIVDPKIIFSKALDHHASSIILIHNHPSGNLKPSEADLRITKKLMSAGMNLDIKVLDHLIVSENGYYSLADEGDM